MHELENELERACKQLLLPHVRFGLERRLQPEGSPRFLDAAHGGVVIEYEAPRAFAGRDGAAVLHARGQAEDYSQLLSAEEGRPLADYALVVWDGPHISFGHWNRETTKTVWRRLRPFDQSAAETLLRYIAAKGVPLVNPLLVTQLVGPDSDVGTEAIAAYASQLSLGVSVVEYLNLPSFDPRDPDHLEISAIAARLQHSNQIPEAEYVDPDRRVRDVLALDN